MLATSASRWFALFALGAQLAPAQAADNRYFAAPVSDSGYYRQYAARVGNTLHTGRDFDDTKSTAIKAVGTGRIVAKYYTGGGDHGLGNTLLVVHPVEGLGFTPVYSMYSHLAGFSAGTNIGAFVTKGQQLGVMGMTGSGSNSIIHLHFEFKTTNTLSDLSGTRWGYIPDTFVDDYTELANAGYRNPTALFFNTQIKYSDFRMTNALPRFAYRSNLFFWTATFQNPFQSAALVDFRLLLVGLDGVTVGTIGTVNGVNVQPGVNPSISFSKPYFLSPAGSYKIRLEHRGSAVGGNWTTTPTPVGGVNPAAFTLY